MNERYQNDERKHRVWADSVCLGYAVALVAKGLLDSTFGFVTSTKGGNNMSVKFLSGTVGL